MTVTGTSSQSELIQQARNLLELARRHGYRRDDLIRLLQQLPTR